MRGTGSSSVIRSIFTGIGAALLAASLTVAGLLVGLSLGHPGFAFGLTMLGILVSLSLAHWFSISLEEPLEDPFSDRPRVSWRLIDPELRNTGVCARSWDRRR